MKNFAISRPHSGNGWKFPLTVIDDGKLEHWIKRTKGKFINSKWNKKNNE